MTSPGLTFTTQVPVSALAIVTLNDAPITDLSARITRDAGLQRALLENVRDAAAGRTATEFLDVLEEADVEATDRDVAALAVRFTRGEDCAGVTLLQTLQTLGQGHSPTEETYVVPRLLSLGDDIPTIGLRLDTGFFDLRRDQREAICEWVTELAAVADVRLAASGLGQRRLFDQHASDLPVDTDDIAALTGGPLAERVEAALNALDPDGRPVQLLRDLADAEDGYLPYNALYSLHQDVDDSTVRNHLGTLADLALVETFSEGRSKSAELLKTGESVLGAIRAEIGRQTNLGDAVDDTGQSSTEDVTFPRDERPPTPAGPYRSSNLGRDRHAAARAVAVDGGVAFLKHPVAAEDSRVRDVRFDAESEEVVAEWTATTPMQTVVSGALALTDLVRKVLTDDRLEDLDESPAILRSARHIGALSDEALADHETLREEFIEWGRVLQDLTTRWHHDDCEDRGKLASEILSTAQGLFGSLTHLYDALGVSVTRVLRVPSGLNKSHFRKIARSLQYVVAIQSTYGEAHSVFRQVFEDRTEKRQDAFGVTVDAADPHADLLGSLVVMGGDVHRFRPILERALDGDLEDDDLEVHDDAPEIAVTVPVTDRSTSRAAYAEVVGRVCGLKGLTPTSEAVSILQLLAGSPYDAAEAIQRGLAPETKRPGRSIRRDEARLALATLDADRIVPEETATVSATLATLLGADEPLMQSELADRADVSTRSLRRNRDRLEALDVVTIVDGAWKLTFEAGNTDEDLVWLTASGGLATVGEHIANTLLGPATYVDVTAPLGTVDGPPDYDRLLKAAPRLHPWLRRLAGVLDESLVVAGDVDVGAADTVVSLGAESAQEPIQEATGVCG